MAQKKRIGATPERAEAIKAQCARRGIEYIGDQADHPIFKEGYSISFSGRSTPSKPATPPNEDSLTSPEQ